jgi:hypothetical protein
LAVNKEVSDIEASLHIGRSDLFDCCEECCCLLRFDHLGSTKFDGARHGHEEGDLVHKHDITRYCNEAVLTHDGNRDVGMYGADVCGRRSSSIAFEQAKIGPKDIFGSDDVLSIDWTVWQQVVVNY